MTLVRARLIGAALVQGLSALRYYITRRKQQQKEQRANEIRQDPNAVAAERFGDPVGRVSIDVKPDD